MPVENKAVFIDSNIWLYTFIAQQDQAKSTIAKNLLVTTPVIVLSTQVINEVCFNLVRKTQISSSVITQLIRSYYTKYVIAELNQDTLLEATDLREEYRLSFWDSLIVASALQMKANILYTEDMHHSLIIRKHLQIINPFLP
jgi:predicted nucleic acid-binding protein